MTTPELERLYTAIEEALDHLPAGEDPREAIRGVGRRLGIPTPDPFIASFLTARAGGDVRLGGSEGPTTSPAAATAAVEIILQWHGPFHLRTPEARRAFRPPTSPAVYLWLVSDDDPTISYVGQTSNLRTRFYEHFGKMLGGGYWLYDPEGLRSDARHSARYEPSYEHYVELFLGDWESSAHLAYENLLSYSFLWASLYGDRSLRETVESALIVEAKRNSAAFQNPRVSRAAIGRDRVTIRHVLPDGLVVKGLGDPTVYGGS